MMKKKTLLTAAVATVALALLAGGGTVYYCLFAPQFRPSATQYVYIDRDDTADSVCHKLQQAGRPHTLAGFRWLAAYRRYPQAIRTGRYAVRPGDDAYHVFSRLYRGYQEPMNLTVGSVRTLDRLARNVGSQLMIDSAEIATLLADTAFVHRLGYTPATLPALFIPNTYEVYWNMSAQEFVARMQREYRRYWNPQRLAKAESMHMTPLEVSTLASIVEEETANDAEKPVVAGLYINRLHARMPLQADPTVKFALRQAGVRRITNADLTVDSPYNTYLHTGLPPGPIRIPSVVGLEAVLNYTRHNYLYMCAKEDFSGTHNFAANYRDHLRNARKYWNALNQRKIYR